MTNYCRDVRAFHDKFDLVTPSSFTFLEQDLHEFRVKFFNEELSELRAAIDCNDVAEAVDALIDLVYITCGAALLHGIDEDKFTDLLSSVRGEEVYSGVFDIGGEIGISPFIEQVAAMIRCNIESYVEAHTDHGRHGRSPGGVQEALGSLYFNCMAGYKLLGFTTPQWNELWDDVQRANMAKERALRPEDSKRGSKWDVIKPEGWVPPRTAALVAKFRGLI